MKFLKSGRDRHGYSAFVSYLLMNGNGEPNLKQNKIKVFILEQYCWEKLKFQGFWASSS